MDPPQAFVLLHIELHTIKAHAVGSWESAKQQSGETDTQDKRERKGAHFTHNIKLGPHTTHSHTKHSTTLLSSSTQPPLFTQCHAKTRRRSTS